MRYIESIKIEHGYIQDLKYHQDRITRTIGRNLNIETAVPDEYCDGVVKCRIIYDESGIKEIGYFNYIEPIIRTLKVIECNDITYDYKFENRCYIDRLMECREGCDDIVIVKNGQITDSSFCNIIFRNKSGLFTSDTPLLEGTKRARLIAEKKLNVVAITIDDIYLYDEIILINAMCEIAPILISEIKIN